MGTNLGYCGPQSPYQQFLQHPCENGLYPPLNFPVTCSFVVLPRDTSTIWNPVNPKIGTNKTPMIKRIIPLSDCIKENNVLKIEQCSTTHTVQNYLMK